MVIQRDKPIYLRGMGAGRVSVAFMGKTYAHFSKGGDFMIDLPAQTAGGPYEMTVDLDSEIDNLYLLDEAGERHLATCRIEGETLVATADIPRAVGIEFGMEPFNEMHLFNGETLPAVEFEDHI